MSDPAGDILCTDRPLADHAYLDDMRGWVGDETLAGLIGGAATVLRTELDALAAAAAAAEVET
ncbi:MAG: hypothetical protein ACM31L_07595, partial [Actinomycetota bacterium]